MMWCKILAEVVEAEDVDVDRLYERRPKASMPASCNHFTEMIILREKV